MGAEQRDEYKEQVRPRDLLDQQLEAMRKFEHAGYVVRAGSPPIVPHLRTVDKKWSVGYHRVRKGVR